MQVAEVVNLQGSTLKKPAAFAWIASAARIFFAGLFLGALLPTGCSAGAIMGQADSAAIVIGFGLTLAGAIAGILLVRRRVARKAAAAGFTMGVAAGAFALWHLGTGLSDWYCMKRCRDGVADACVGVFRQGSALAERDNFYAPRRGCALGNVTACGAAFHYVPARNDETCPSTRRICQDGRAALGHKAMACRMVDEYCVHAP